MSHLFPLAFLSNAFAMTVLLITLGLVGDSAMAADVGIIQGATLALFFAFSANARSLILSKSSTISAHFVMIARMGMLIPLAITAYWLSVGVANINQSFAVILILRRVVEWLGEVHLSEMERLENQRFARNYFVIQSVLLGITLIWVVGDFPYPLLGLFFWAFLPLLISISFIWKSITTLPEKLNAVILKMLPHFGSTAIIGITVYVFRLLILLLLGKEIAGDLYTAFAIGGLTGSVFANALGASIALHEQRSGKRYFPSALRSSLSMSLLFGICIFLVSVLQLPILSWTGKSYLFWQATGLSLIGGVIMVYAQRIRFRVLQQDEERDVYGPDVMMNMLLIGAMPFIFYLLGLKAMGSLYLLSSALAYVFYTSAEKEKDFNLPRVTLKTNILKMLIGVLILLPLFIQIGSGIFKHPAIIYDADGALVNLPIPVSVLICYLGIALLGGYRQAIISLNFIFFTCVMMILTSVLIASGNAAQEQAKFIFLIQFILPMFALVLGQLYQRHEQDVSSYTFEKAFLYVLVIIVPLQLVSTWMQGHLFLSPYLYIFSIYQHLQYVPVVFLSAYLVAFYQLWQNLKFRKPLILLTPLMGVYAAASTSILALGLFVGGILLYAILYWNKSKDIKLLIVSFVAVLVAAGYFVFVINNTTFVAEKFSAPKHGEEVRVLHTTNEKLLPGLSQRYEYWRYYWKEGTSDTKTFMFGHPVRPERNLYPSAYNYYLDFIYNFGFFALLPMLITIGYTFVQIFRRRRDIWGSPALLGLSLVVLFLLIADNSLKVGLRQPYPGIFTFFLWGILLTNLSRLTNKKLHKNA
jgi:hypothetical protein